MPAWKDDDELFAMARRELFTAVTGDVMDKMRLFHQYLPAAMRPLRPEMVLLGRAMPALSVDICEEISEGTANALMAKPFGLMLDALDDLKRHEVYLSTGSSPRNAMWGELMTLRATRLGAAGAALNGFHRDTRPLLELDFPVFSFGAYGQDAAPRYKVVDFRTPVEIGGVRVQPGDILFGDLDGVCAVPREAEVEVFSRAFEKARGEKLVRQAIEEGSSAVAAFAKFGIM